jgi:hypothetical protein
VDVSGEVQLVRISVHVNRLVPSLKQGPDTTESPIDRLGIRESEGLHVGGKVIGHQASKYVIVGWHQAVGSDLDCLRHQVLPQLAEEEEVVVTFKEDRLEVGAAVVDVIVLVCQEADSSVGHR